jgi:hypothetical protein
MVADRKVSYSTLFTYLVKWYAIAVSLSPGDVILVQLAFPRMTSFFVYIMNNWPISQQTLGDTQLSKQEEEEEIFKCKWP